MVILNAVLLMLIYMIEPYLWIKSMSTLVCRYQNRKIYFMAAGMYYIITLVKQFLAFSDVVNVLNIIMNITVIVYMFLSIIILVKSSICKRIFHCMIFYCLSVVTELPFMIIATCLFKVSMVQVVSFGIINNT